MELSKQLARTEHVKHATYWGDGMGRDSYIITGNGGLVGDANMPSTSPWTGYQPSKNTTAFYTNQGHQLKRLTAHKDATALKYFGDGTGRDSYVVADSGGNVPKYVNKGVMGNFQNGLRQHDNGGKGQGLSINRRTILNPCQKPSDPNTQGHDPASGMWYNESVRQAIKQCYQSQRNQSKRLANPKSQRQKFMDVDGSQSRTQSMRGQQASANAQYRKQKSLLLMSSQQQQKGRTERRNLQIQGNNNKGSQQQQAKMHRNSLLNAMAQNDFVNSSIMGGVSVQDVKNEIAKASEKCLNCGTLRMTSLGQDPSPEEQQQIQFCDLHRMMLATKIKAVSKKPVAQSFQRVPHIKQNEQQWMTQEKLVQSKDHIAGLIEPLQIFENSLKQSATQQRVRTSQGTNRHHARTSQSTASPSMSGAKSLGRIRQGDFKSIQQQIADYQNKIKQLQAQSTQFNSIDFPTQHTEGNEAACTSMTHPVTRNGSVIERRSIDRDRDSSRGNDQGNRGHHNASTDFLKQKSNFRNQSQTSIDQVCYRDSVNQSQELFQNSREQLARPQENGQISKKQKQIASGSHPYVSNDFRVKKNYRIKPATVLRQGANSCVSRDQTKHVGKFGSVDFWQSIDQYQTAAKGRNRNEFANLSVEDGMLAAQLDKRRYNSLDRQMCSQSVSSLNNNDQINNDYYNCESAEPIKVLNGRDSNHQRHRQKSTNGNGAIDMGGQTLEQTTLNMSRSPNARKPQTAANGNQKRRNLKELLKLFQNSGVPLEVSRQSSIMKADIEFSPDRQSSDAQPQRMTSTLDPNQTGSPTRRKKNLIGKQSVTQTSGNVMRQTTRAFTQMSTEMNKDSMVDVSGNDMHLLDLRDQCSASAKLEKLKARYQKQQAAVALQQKGAQQKKSSQGQQRQQNVARF